MTDVTTGTEQGMVESMFSAEELAEIRADLERKKIAKARTEKIAELTKDPALKELYDNHGLKSIIDEDPEILDSTSALKLAIKDAKSKYESAKNSTQTQTTETETVTTQTTASSEPARQQTSMTSSVTTDEVITPARETVDSFSKKMGVSVGEAAFAKTFCRNFSN